MPDPFHTNRGEEGILQALVAGLQHPGTAEVAMQIGLPLIQGAMARREENVDQRQAGLQALQQQAMQLAAQGASADAVQAATLGQANDLPLMGTERGQGMLGDLAGYVGGLYQGGTDSPYGPISGLAPLDIRSQFQPAVEGLTPENKAAVGTIVVQNLQAGVPLVNIREMARQYAIANGGSEADVEEAVQVAESTYGQATGMDPAAMRSTGDLLRNIQSSDPGWLEGLPGMEGVDPSTVNVQQYLGAQAASPGGLSSLQPVVSGYQPPAPSWTSKVAGWLNPFG